MSIRTVWISVGLGGAVALAIPMPPTPMLTLRLLDASGRPTAPIEAPSVSRSEEEWKARFTAEQFRIGRAHGTERAFCGAFHDTKKEGIYSCAGCGLPLFRSEAKFDSGTGWPSFFQPFAEENIGVTIDRSYGMVREEVHCVRCGTHLGHVFPDGPRPTGLRYCINSAVLNFHEAGPAKTETVFFGGGDVMRAQAAFAAIPGVLETEAGFPSGSGARPARAGAAEADVVKVTYDPASNPFEKLLEAFLELNSSSAANGPDADPGIIFFTTPAQETAARIATARLETSRKPRIDLAPPFARAENVRP